MGGTGGCFTNRLILSVLLLLGSLILTALLWSLGFSLFFLFLFVPFLPLLGGRRETRQCPVCGWETNGNERYCPYDGVELISSDGRVLIHPF